MSIDYLCLENSTFTKGLLTFVPIRQVDMENIRLWRNAQLEILRQTNKISQEEQISYYKHLVLPTFSQEHPSQILFSLLEGDLCIGYGGLTNISWENRRGEVSFLLETERSKDPDLFQQTFSFLLGTLTTISFDQLKLHKIMAETYVIRPYVVSLLEENGFTYEGKMRDHIWLKEDKLFIDSLIHSKINTR